MFFACFAVKAYYIIAEFETHLLLLGLLFALSRTCFLPHLWIKLFVASPPRAADFWDAPETNAKPKIRELEPTTRLAPVDPNPVIPTPPPNPDAYHPNLSQSATPLVPSASTEPSFAHTQPRPPCSIAKSGSKDAEKIIWMEQLLKSFPFNHLGDLLAVLFYNPPRNDDPRIDPNEPDDDGEDLSNIQPSSRSTSDPMTGLVPTGEVDAEDDSDEDNSGPESELEESEDNGGDKEY
ncbi:hypothetical protein B0H14DRAFT_2626564 [Mycena olivaceomarginata]|nr:hypothetical protein B0H14DRAFT_2626564 [Mycena olivaceomarginata]